MIFDNLNILNQFWIFCRKYLSTQFIFPRLLFFPSHLLSDKWHSNRHLDNRSIFIGQLKYPNTLWWTKSCQKYWCICCGNGHSTTIVCVTQDVNLPKHFQATSCMPPLLLVWHSTETPGNVRNNNNKTDRERKFWVGVRQ